MSMFANSAPSFELNSASPNRTSATARSCERFGTMTLCAPREQARAAFSLVFTRADDHDLPMVERIKVFRQFTATEATGNAAALNADLAADVLAT